MLYAGRLACVDLPAVSIFSSFAPSLVCRDQLTARGHEPSLARPSVACEAGARLTCIRIRLCRRRSGRTAQRPCRDLYERPAGGCPPAVLRRRPAHGPSTSRRRWGWTRGRGWEAGRVRVDLCGPHRLEGARRPFSREGAVTDPVTSLPSAMNEWGETHSSGGCPSRRAAGSCGELWRGWGWVLPTPPAGPTTHTPGASPQAPGPVPRPVQSRRGAPQRFVGLLPSSHHCAGRSARWLCARRPVRARLPQAE